MISKVSEAAEGVMGEIKLSVTINRPAREVFDFCLDPENTPKWVDGIVKEQASESPAKLGTVYRNQDHEGNWSEFEITELQPGVMFVLRKREDNYHVKYVFKPHGDNGCELEYEVWNDTGDIGERFAPDKLQALLQKLKIVMEEPAS